MKALEVKNLTSRIGNFMLGPVDLSVEQGKIVGIVGPSGCGKTLLLRTIAGLNENLTGTVYMNGEDISEIQVSKRNLAFVFQDNALFPHLDTYENIAFPLKIQKHHKKKQIKNTVAVKAEELDGLYEYLEKIPKELPAGIKKLTAIARETIKKFNMIFMDEPFERLDKSVRNELRTMIKKVLLEIGHAVLIVLNDAEDAISLTSKVYIMRNGRIDCSGNPVEIYNNPPTNFALDLFSLNGVNRVGNLIFRPEDVVPDKDGIETIIHHSAPLDGKRIICNATIQGSPVQLILPYGFRDKPFLKIKIIRTF